jgi:hypothetical protein
MKFTFVASHDWGVVTAKNAENAKFSGFLAAPKSDEGGSI